MLNRASNLEPYLIPVLELSRGKPRGTRQGPIVDTWREREITSGIKSTCPNDAEEKKMGVYININALASDFEAFGLAPADATLLFKMIKEYRDHRFEYVKNRAFLNKHAEQNIPPFTHPDIDDVQSIWYGMLNAGKKLTRGHILKAAEERAAFMRYNYCKYKLTIMIARCNNRLTKRTALAMLEVYKEVIKMRQVLVTFNLGLICKVYDRLGIRSNPYMDDLLSDGRITIMRSVEKYDVSKGFKFSTYAWRALTTSYHYNVRRYTKDHSVQIDGQLHPFTQLYETYEPPNKDHTNIVIQNIDLRDAILDNRAVLTENEKHVILGRFWHGMTLHDVSRRIGVTKERARQCQDEALAKLSVVLHGRYHRERYLVPGSKRARIKTN